MRFARLASGLLVVLGSIAHAAEGDDLVVTGSGVNVRAEPRSGAPILLQVHQPERAVELVREGDWVRVQLPDHDTVGWIHGSLLAAAEGAAPPRLGGDRAAAPPAAAAPAETTPSAGAGGTGPAAEAPSAASAASGAADGVAPRAPVATPATPASAGGDQAAAQSAHRGDPQVTAVDVSATEALARFRASVETLNSGALAAAGVNLFGDVRIAGGDVAQVTAGEAWDMVPEGGRQSYLNVLHDRWLEIVGSPPASVQIVDQGGRVLSERAGP
jgi:hypothetical protein